MRFQHQAVQLGWRQVAQQLQPLVQGVQQVLELYGQFRRKLETLVALQDRMLIAYERLDALLADAPGNLVISGPVEAPPPTVDELISKRTFSTVQFRFHQALNLADLALHLDAKTAAVLAHWAERLAVPERPRNSPSCARGSTDA